MNSFLTPKLNQVQIEFEKNIFNSTQLRIAWYILMQTIQSTTTNSIIGNRDENT